MQGDLVAHGSGPRRVVISMPLPRTAEDRLRESLGGGTQIVDITDADGTEDVVITPAVSPQLLHKLHQAFPHAQVLVIELEDDDFDVHFGGPVTRLLRSGADGYFVASSIDQVAALLGQPEPARATSHELPSAREDDLAAIIDVIIEKSAAAAPQHIETPADQ